MNQIEFDATFSLIKKLGPHCTMVWLKTLFGGWVTTARVRASNDVFRHFHVRDSCMFGCRQCADSWEHYCRCSVLWCAVQCAIPSFKIDEDPLKLLSVHCPPRSQIAGIILAFHVFHSFKNRSNVMAEELCEAVRANFFHYVRPILNSRSD